MYLFFVGYVLPENLFGVSAFRENFEIVVFVLQETRELGFWASLTSLSSVLLIWFLIVVFNFFFLWSSLVEGD